MESYLLEWANVLLRWVHAITAIAWIGPKGSSSRP